MVNYVELDVNIKLVTTRDTRGAVLDAHAVLDKALGELSCSRMFLVESVTVWHNSEKVDKHGS
jgi:hypothetical protein